MASYGLVTNMILYLMKDYHLGVAKGTNVLFFWTAATNFMPILGAFLSDSYLGRFLTIGLASFCSLLVTKSSFPFYNFTVSCTISVIIIITTLIIALTIPQLIIKARQRF